MSHAPLKLAIALAGLTPVEPEVAEVIPAASVIPPAHCIAACCRAARDVLAGPGPSCANSPPNT